MKLPLVIFICLLCFGAGFLYCANFSMTRKTLNLMFSTMIGSTDNTPIVNIDKKESTSLSFPGYNFTHLWSWNLRDHIYSEVANAIPCRVINYGGSTSKIDTCDKSDRNEFSLSNSIKAQKWIYEHQHPVDCSNKRFAIIHQMASSGFGSTVHQIAWAFGMALSEGRIAVYKSPSNWVITHKKVTFLFRNNDVCFSYMVLVAQLILIVYFYHYLIVPFHQLLMVIKLFISNQILVIGINLYFHGYFKIEHLIGIEHN